MTVRRRALAAALAAAAVVVAAGCAALPTAGPIHQGEAPVESDVGGALPVPARPGLNDGPEAIVRGFLAASAAGVTDNYEVARLFLAASAQSWRPSARTTVYSVTDLTVDVEDDEVGVSGPIAATVDDAGRYFEAEPGEQVETTFGLSRDSSGQWRISSLEDGVLVSEPTFAVVYRPVPLYFLSPDKAYLVPELRYLAIGSTLATSAVQALFAGPSPWLIDAVDTAVPAGARLVGGVSVREGVAAVDLSDTAIDMAPADRALLRGQLEAVLERLPGEGIRTVNLTVQGAEFTTPPAPGLALNPTMERGPVMLAGDTLVTLDGTRLAPVDDVADLAGLDPSHPALGYDGTQRVVLADGGTRLLDVDGTQSRELLSGADLIAPSVDRFGWVWSGPSASTGQLTAVGPTGTVLEVAADRFAGRSVDSLRVSRDGARVAVVTSGNDGVSIDVAAIVRDGTGAPQRLGDVLRIGATLASAREVTWVDETTVAVLAHVAAPQADAVTLVTVGGPTSSPLTGVEDVTSVTAGRGERSMYLVTADGTLYTRTASSWREVATGVRDPAYPG